MINKIGRKTAILLISFLLLGALIGLFLPYQPQGLLDSTQFSQGTVTKVIDGDTIIVDGKTVRLLGIDTDERNYPCYEEAKKRLEELILGKEVLLEKGEENRDQYDRLLRYVYLNQTDINFKLIQEGLAVTRSVEGLKYGDQYLEAEKEARDSKTGCKWQIDDWTAVKDQKNTTNWSLKPQGEFKLVEACQTSEEIGKKAIVEGRIVDSYQDDKVIFLNFARPYPNSCFTAVIFSDSWSKFPQSPEDFYLDRKVRVKGQIEEYKNSPEIVLENKSQIDLGR